MSGFQPEVAARVWSPLKGRRRSCLVAENEKSLGDLTITTAEPNEVVVAWSGGWGAASRIWDHLLSSSKGQVAFIKWFAGLLNELTGIPITASS